MAPSASVETLAREERLAAACAYAWAVMAPQSRASAKTSPSVGVLVASLLPNVVVVRC